MRRRKMTRRREVTRPEAKTCEPWGAGDSEQRERKTTEWGKILHRLYRGNLQTCFLRRNSHRIQQNGFKLDKMCQKFTLIGSWNHLHILKCETFQFQVFQFCGYRLRVKPFLNYFDLKKKKKHLEMIYLWSGFHERNCLKW